MQIYDTKIGNNEIKGCSYKGAADIGKAEGKLTGKLNLLHNRRSLMFDLKHTVKILWILSK